MVMMIIRSTDGRSSQRMKQISTKAPTSMVTATAPATASGRGSQFCREMAVMAPSMTNSPWAKLMMPVVL